MSQWHGYVYKHGAHIVGISPGIRLPSWMRQQYNGRDGYFKTIGLPYGDKDNVMLSHPTIRKMANASSGGAYWMTTAMAGSLKSRAYYRQTLSRYPGYKPFNGSPTKDVIITVTGPFLAVYASIGWAAIGRAHDHGGDRCQIWAEVRYYNNVGAHINTYNLGRIENAGGDVVGYRADYAKTLIYNRKFDCPAGTARVDFWYRITVGGYEAHDTGDRGPASWNPDVDLYAGGYALGMLMSDNTEEHRNNIQL